MQSSGAVEYTNCISAEVQTPPMSVLDNDIKPSDGKAPALEIWGIRCTPSLPLLPGPLWPGLVAPDRVLSMGQIEQTLCKQMTDVKLWLLYSILRVLLTFHILAANGHTERGVVGGYWL